MTKNRFHTLLRTEPEANTKFSYIDPPFNFNHPDIAKYPPEVTGCHLLQSLCRRIGWPSLKGKRLLDFGCGVRFARTIVNLGVDIDLYVGVDVDAKAIAWLKANVDDARLRFELLNMYNPMYNSAGSEIDEASLARMGLTELDAACMFSVITHQAPQDAAKIFSMLYRCVAKGGSLYFTAFTDEAVDDYVERDPANPRLLSTYNPEALLGILENSGWTALDAFPPTSMEQTAFVCRK
jgi:SAM-dependent methyltransferase